MAIYLVISDIHANPEALRQIMNVVSRHYGNVDIQVRCLGDIVGYGYDPVEAFRLINEIDPDWRAGNHDLYYALLAAGRENEWRGDQFSSTAHRVLHVHRTLFEASGRAFPTVEQIRQRTEPRFETSNDYTLIFVHAGLDNHKEGYVAEYVLPDEQKKHQLVSVFQALADRSQESPIRKTILFSGHTHVPMLLYAQTPDQPAAWSANYATPEQPSYCVNLNDIDASLFIVNGGAINMPRDGVGVDQTGRKFRAHAVVLDTEHHLVRFLQVQYEYETTIWQRLNQSVLLKIDEGKIDSGVRDSIVTRYTKCPPHPGHERFFYTFDPAGFTVKQPEITPSKTAHPSIEYTPLIQAQRTEYRRLQVRLENTLRDGHESTVAQIENSMKDIEDYAQGFDEFMITVDPGFPLTDREMAQRLRERTEQRLVQLQKARRELLQAESLETKRREIDTERAGMSLPQLTGALATLLQPREQLAELLKSTDLLHDTREALRQYDRQWADLAQRFEEDIHERKATRRKLLLETAVVLAISVPLMLIAVMLFALLLRDDSDHEPFQVPVSYIMIMQDAPVFADADLDSLVLDTLARSDVYYRVVTMSPDWYEIVLPDGRQGWIAASKVEVLGSSQFIIPLASSTPTASATVFSTPPSAEPANQTGD